MRICGKKQILAALLLLLTLEVILAQSPSRSRAGGRVLFPRYKPGTSILIATMTGSNATPLHGGWVRLDDFEIQAFRDVSTNGLTNEVQAIALAPECRVEQEKGIASDPGPIQIYTPTTNLFVQGTGFFFAESNQVLILSNQVETRVIKSMLRAPFLPAPKTNVPAETGQFLKIFAEHGQFDYRTNLVNYSGHVRVEDPEFQMLSPFLSIQFTNQEAVEEVSAWDHVTVTMTNKGTATADTGTYFDTNGVQTILLAGHAEWHNGGQTASASNFIYDPGRRFLIADEAAHVLWPVPVTDAAAPALFRELFADYATLQMSPDGQLVDTLRSEGNVIIVNQADQSRAMAAKAVYNRTNDLVELTGDAHWWNDKMNVWGDTLSAAPTNQIFHAREHARLKYYLSSTNGPPGHATNQWLDISADDIVKETNLVTFRGSVEARMLDGDETQDTLTAALLLVTLDASDQLQTVVARGNVHAESTVDAKGVKKTITCETLTAQFRPGGSLLRTVEATEKVVMQANGAGPLAVFNQVTASAVTAYFSALTNQLESAEAEGAVEFHQTKATHSIRATGDRGHYTLAPEEQVELTGHAWAQNEKYAVSDADRLDWMVNSGELKVFGRYRIAPSTNAAPHEAKLVLPAP